MIDTNYKIATPLKDTEDFNVSFFCGPFHDGEIYYIKNEVNKIKIYMDSFPLYFNNDELPAINSRYFKLTLTHSYKGCLLLEDVLDWSIDGEKNREFIHDYVWIEILDFEIQGNEVNFLVDKRFLKNGKKERVWERYIFHANSIKWVNFEHISEDEYDCEISKEDFFEDIRDLMNKPQN